MKVGIAVIVIALLALGAFVFMGPSEESVEVFEDTTEVVDETLTEAVSGEYTIVAESSIVNWAGQKPLIDGYINSGILGVTSGNITLGENPSGSFEIDMNTLQVSETKAKPGAEATLEDHLKSERWFDVEGFPTASFEILSLAKSASDEPFMYDVVGNLTMKGEPGEVSFPAKIYTNENGSVQAEASFEIDRTLWGITAGSGSFFDNLADNVVDDMVSISFTLVAEQSEGEAMEEADEDAIEEEVTDDSLEDIVMPEGEAAE